MNLAVKKIVQTFMKADELYDELKLIKEMSERRSAFSNYKLRWSRNE